MTQKRNVRLGDNIYIIEPYGIEEASITEISEADDIDCFCFEVYIDPDYHEIIALEEFNDTWFLSREEAEAKLKEMEEKDIYMVSGRENISYGE